MRIFLLIGCLFAVLLSFGNAEEKEKPLTFFEVRTYQASEGKLDELHKRFRDHASKLLKKHEMTSIVHLEPVEEGSNSLTYILGFHSQEQRDTNRAAFWDDEVWLKAFEKSEENGTLVDNVESSFFTIADYSPKFYASSNAKQSEGEGQLFEIRTYTTNAGKLDDLDARFRDHTIALFAKHGMKNILYLHPAEGEKGYGTTLKYIIAHKDMDTRNASFKAFGKDPAWQAVKKNSEEEGKILVEDGVVNAFYKASDYSPLK
ncbi:NIPSNAP family protein [Akkermansiaceae bacterium]|nr:NIPSNAP family protein [Akkermansiaceae bacterium]